MLFIDVGGGATVFADDLFNELAAERPVKGTMRTLRFKRNLWRLRQENVSCSRSLFGDLLVRKF